MAYILGLGSIWGILEAVVHGLFPTTGSFAAGSVLTAIAFFFFSLSWFMHPRWYNPIILLLTAITLTLISARVLAVPFSHGSVVNPLFAYFQQALLVTLLLTIGPKPGELSYKSLAGRGAAAGLLAALSFPLASFVTGMPVCAYAGTSMPLSILYAPLTAGLSAAAFPLAKIISDQIHAHAFFKNPVLASWCMNSLALVLYFVVTMYK